MAELESMSPDITLFHILPRLPAKSVTRFKCVSKQWHSFIMTDQFPKMHLVHQNQQKLLFLPHNKAWDFFTIDCETPEDGCTAIRPFPFKVGSCQEISIAASLHGMVCVLLTNKTGCGHLNKVSDIILWNPVTGDHKTLSKAGSHRHCYETSEHRYGLYYSSSEDDYKIVCVTDSHPIIAYIYSLKSDSWRNVGSRRSCSSLYPYPPGRSVLLKEKFYFVDSFSVTTFDTQTEKPRYIKTPLFENQRTYCTGFMVVRDCIHFGLEIKKSEGRYDGIGQWRMDRDGDGDWTKVETCSLEEHLYDWSYEPRWHLMRNGNWLMYSDFPEHLTRNKTWPMHNTWGGCVYVLDAKNHTKHVMCSIRFAFRPQGKFIETFVSPNQYIKL